RLRVVEPARDLDGRREIQHETIPARGDKPRFAVEGQGERPTRLQHDGGMEVGPRAVLELDADGRRAGVLEKELEDAYRLRRGAREDGAVTRRALVDLRAREARRRRPRKR